MKKYPIIIFSNLLLAHVLFSQDAFTQLHHHLLQFGDSCSTNFSDSQYCIEIRCRLLQRNLQQVRLAACERMSHRWYHLLGRGHLFINSPAPNLSKVRRELNSPLTKTHLYTQRRRFSLNSAKSFVKIFIKVYTRYGLVCALVEKCM